MEIKHLTPQRERTPQRGLWSIHDAIDRIFDDFYAERGAEGGGESERPFEGPAARRRKVVALTAF